MDELFACEIGTALWNTYRAAHPSGERDPDVDPLRVAEPPPELLAFWNHQATCGNCLEW